MKKGLQKAASNKPPISNIPEVIVQESRKELLAVFPKQIPFKIVKTQENQKKNEEDKNATTNALIQQIELYFNEQLTRYDGEESKKFEFKLPNTIFSKKDKEIRFKSPLDTVDYGAQGACDLDKNQLADIWNTGTFKVYSSKFGKNYIWKMSTWIVKGRSEILNSLFHDLAFAFSQTLQIKKRFYTKRSPYAKRLFTPTIYHAGQNVFRFLRNVVAIFIGLPQKRKSKSESQIINELQRERNLRLCEDSKVDVAFFQYLHGKNAEVISEDLKALESAFLDIWNKKKYDVDEKISDDDENKMRKIQKEMNASFLGFLESQKQVNFTPSVKKSLLDYYSCIVFLNEQNFLLQKQMESLREEIKDRYKKNHRIKSLVCDYMEAQVELLYQKAIETVVKESEERILQYLLKFPDKKYIYDDLTKFKETFHQKVKQIYDSVPLEPRKIFYMQRNIFPPWKVVKMASTYSNKETFYYYLEKRQTIEFRTDHFGWRVTIWFYRFYVWTNNIMYWLFFMAISSPLGIKALVYRQKFYIDKRIDMNTGVVSDTVQSQTVWSCFLNVCSSIRSDRERFEREPDNGFFGKKFSRLGNLFYNYCYKLILINIIIVLALYPAAIIINTIVCLTLALTAWAWCPFVLIFSKLFQVFIYDVDNTDYGQDPSLSLFFPIFTEIIKFIFRSVGQMLYALIGLVLHPLLAILAVLTGILRYLIRSIYDLFLFRIVKLLGRVPARDTKIAWKISGPGLCRNYYTQIELRDALILFRAQMERLELNKYKSEAMEKISEPLVKAEKLLKEVFTPFRTTLNYLEPQELNHDKHILETKLQEQVGKRIGMFPQNPYGVRFSTTELLILLKNCEKILRNFVQRRDMTFLFQHFDIKENDWEKLTMKVIAEIFGYEAQQPLEELENRFSLTAEGNDEFSEILRIMEGENGGGFENLKPKVGERARKFLHAPGFIHLSIFRMINSNTIHNDKDLSMCISYGEYLSEKKKREEEESKKIKDAKKPEKKGGKKEGKEVNNKKPASASQGEKETLDEPQQKVKTRAQTKLEEDTKLQAAKNKEEVKDAKKKKKK